MKNESELNVEEQAYLKAHKSKYMSPYAGLVPGTYTLKRWYPIGLLLVIFLLSIVVPLYSLSLTDPSLAIIERAPLAQFILLASILIIGVCVFYLKAIVQKSLVLEKDKTIFINGKALDYNKYLYIRFYTVQTSAYSGSKPSMIVFSNIKNDIWRFLVASYFPFFGNTLVVHVYKIKNPHGQKIENAALVEMTKEQSKKHEFRVCEMKGVFAISGWLAIT